MILGVALGLAPLLGVALAVRRGGLPAIDRVLLVVTPPALVILVAAILPEIVLVLDDDMSASRTVPALALARGFPIYAGPDAGPIIDFMYGPIAAIAFLPAALADRPSGVLAIAVAVNVVAFFAPMLWCIAATGVPARIAVAAAVVFGFLVLWDPGLRFSGLSIHADAPALGLCALACVPFVRRTGVPDAAALGLSAACAALAVWTKQTSLPIVVALPLWLVAVGARRAAVRWVEWLMGIGIVLSSALLLGFGPRELWYNMVTLPGRMPWYDEATRGKLPAAVRSWRLLADQARWTVMLLVALIAGGSRGIRGAGGVRAWARAQPWTLLVLIGMLGTPMAVLGGAKVGGYLNTHSVTNYFLAGAVACGVARLAAEGHRLPRAMLLALLVGLAGTWFANPRARAQVAPTIARLSTWSTNPQEQAYAFARAHAGEVHLPWNPMATLLADGRLWSNEIGAWNRDLAGVPVTDAQWRRSLPPDARWLAFRPPRNAFAALPVPTARLPEYATPVQMPGLEGWIVRERTIP